ncbi:MAG: quinone-dependent dihydroorotate dehydrogenase [Alistipes sp.]|nr:quinone-dependent dihydroorotate dehydrogenase [Alistipes sp.]
MYKKIIRPLLFVFSPERVHKLTVGMLRAAGYIPGMRRLMGSVFTYNDPSLERDVFGIHFKNPVGLAAGFDKDATQFPYLAPLGFGFIEFGTVTPRAQPGNPKPRLFRLKRDRALINRMGFNNRGVEAMAKNLARKRKYGLVIGGNLGKNTLTPNEQAPADYLKLFRMLYQFVDYFVINVSCPNVKDVTSLQNSQSLMAILEPLFDFRRGQNDYRPILLKISPDLSREQIDEIVTILIDTQLDGLVAVNTTTSRDGLQTPANEVEAIGNGGLSGAPLTERAIETVAYLHEKTEGRYPIIGVGGVMSREDALRMLEAGASLVQVYTGFIYEGPGFVKRICKYLAGKNR